MSRTASPVVTGAHLVGSINQPDAVSTFRIVAEHLGEHAPRIPDGEIGERFYWIQFQTLRFDKTPGLERVGEPGFAIRGQFDQRPLRLDGTIAAEDIVFYDLGYAEAAIDSYAHFAELKAQGVIPASTRFQVSLPTPAGVVGAFFVPELRAAIEGPYTAALFGEVARIAEAIPHEELAIQWDNAVEFAWLEVERAPLGLVPWWDDVLEGVLDRAAAQAAVVPEGVQLGYHLCYGDIEEAHFVQPEDAGVLAAVSAGILSRAPRRVDFLHLPVPIERDDEAYFAPLAEVAIPEGTQLLLGLVHHEDGLEGARRRIAAAGTAVAAFGIATECGFGRGPAERTGPLLDLHREILEDAASTA